MSAVLIACGSSLPARAEFLAQIRLEVTDLSGTPINSIAPGGDFRLNAYVMDLRDAAPFQGVFAAYSHATFDDDLTLPVGSFTFGSFFNVARTGEIIPGEIRGAGGSSTSFMPPGPAEQFLFSHLFHAEAVGQLTFSPSPSLQPGHDFLLYGTDERLATEFIDLIAADLTIVPEPGAFVLAAGAAGALALIVYKRRRK
jgi:hypothetical protein